MLSAIFQYNHNAAVKIYKITKEYHYIGFLFVIFPAQRILKIICYMDNNEILEKN